jgi:oligopeptide/dipeptide ABC transporter ATP-binding protein
MIFQDPLSSLNPVYTIGDQLFETLDAHFEMPKSKMEEKIFSTLHDVHLFDPKSIIKSYPHQLSGGMLQRVMIAMALLCDPDILIADEPTTALDVSIQAGILTLLKEIQEKRGMSTLLITHDMGVVAENADEVVVLYAGQKVEEGPVSAIFDHPSHPYTQGLFACRPKLGAKKRLPIIAGQVPSLIEKPEGCLFHPRCPWAMDLCQNGTIPETAIHVPDHLVKCWLFDKELQWKLTDDEAFRS